MCRILWLINVHVWDELLLRVGEFKYLGDADAVLICCGAERAEHEGKTFNLPVDLHSCPEPVEVVGCYSSWTPLRPS